jgi:hypothetical protein
MLHFGTLLPANAQVMHQFNALTTLMLIIVIQLLVMFAQIICFKLTTAHVVVHVLTNAQLLDVLNVLQTIFKLMMEPVVVIVYLLLLTFIVLLTQLLVN